MAASFQAKDSQVLQQQLAVQELCLFANNSLISDDSTNLNIELNEKIVSVLHCIKQVAGGTVSGVVPSIQNDGNGNPTIIRLAGETGAASTTRYLVKYIAAE